MKLMNTDSELLLLLLIRVIRNIRGELNYLREFALSLRVITGALIL